MNLSTVLLAAFFGFMAVTLGYAWIRGGRTERAGVLLLLTLAVISFAAHPVTQPRFDELDVPALIEDAIGFAGFTWIGLHARRYWPLCAAAMQLLSIAAHFARVMPVDIHPMVYSLMKSTPTAIVCLLIAIGARNVQRRLRAATRSAASNGRQARPL